MPNADGSPTPDEIKKYIDDQIQKNGGGTSGGGTASTGPKVTPPEGFTKEVPGYNGTRFFNPDSRAIWTAPQGSLPSSTLQASKIEQDRIMGAGWSDQQAAAAKTTAPPVQTGPVPNGFAPGLDPTNAYRATSTNSKGQATGPEKVYWNGSTWVGPIKISADEYNSFSKAAPVTSGATSPTAGAATTQPATGGQPAAQPAGAPAAAPPSLTSPPLGAMSPYAQSLNTTTSGITPDRYGPPLSYTVPGALDQKTGQMNIVQPGGQTTQQFVPYMGTASAYNPTPPVGAPAPTIDQGTNRTASSFALVPGQTPKVQDPLAGTVTPPPVPSAPAAASLPPAPVSQEPVPAQLPSIGPSVMPGALVVNGKTLPPDVVDAVQKSWPAELVPQALAIVAREGTYGTPTRDNSTTGPGGTPLNNQFQQPTLPSGAPNPYYNSIDSGLFGINSTNYASLGLTPESAKDPYQNAAAAYQLYQRSGPQGNSWNPWTRNGELPLPPAAQMPTGPAPNYFDNLRNGINTASQAVNQRGLSGIAPSLINGTQNLLNTYTGAGSPPANAGIPAIQPPAAPPPLFTWGLDGPQIAHLNSPSQGYNPQTVILGNGGKLTGNDAQDAVLAARIILSQAPGGGYGDPLATQGVGASRTFQSPLSGQLENEQRTDHGYAFSPGNVNATESLRSPMNSGMYTPIMTPQGVVLQGANVGSPASQAMAYQQAGYGPRPMDANRQPDATQAPYMMSPTSNVGAAIQAAQAQAAQPQLSGQQFTGGAYLAGPNPNSNLGPTPVDYANAANLPSGNQLQTLAQANKDPLAGDTGFANGPAGGGNTQYFAAGGNFDEPAGGIENRLGGVEGGYGHGTPAPFRLGTDSQGNLNVNDVQRALQQVSAAGHSGYQPRVIAPSHPMMLARGGSFITTQPTMFPMRGGGTAETSEYGQPELINQRGNHIRVTPMSHASNMSPLRGYANGGTFNTTSAQAPNTTVSDGGGFTPEGNPIPTDAPAPTAPAPTSAPADPFTQQGNPISTYTPPSAPPADLPPTNNNQFTPQGGLNPNYVTPGQTPAPTQNLDFNTPSATAGDLSLAPLTPGPAASPTAASLDTNPELGTQTGLANQQNARNNRAYLYSAAGVGAPIGISSATQPTNLGPNQYWAPIDYTGQIQNRQTQLAALSPSILGPNGQPLDPNSLVARQNVLRDMLGRVWGGNQPVVSGGTQPAPQGGITDIDPGVNDPTTGQWMTQSQIQAEMAANSLQTQNIQQANQLEAEIANLRANQPSVTPQPVMSQNTSAAQTNAAPTPASNPNLQVFLNALNDQSNTGAKRKTYDPMAAKAA